MPGPPRSVSSRYGSNGKSINVSLDKTTVKILRKLGKGNLSEGIRVAARLVRDPGATPPPVIVVPPQEKRPAIPARCRGDGFSEWDD